MFVARRRHKRKKKAIASQGFIRGRPEKVKASKKATAKAPEKIIKRGADSAVRSPAKPKGREVLKKLFDSYEGLLTASGGYRLPPIPKPPKLPRKIKLNPNRFGPSPFSGLQSAGMPGNEEMDPGPRRHEMDPVPRRRKPKR